MNTKNLEKPEKPYPDFPLYAHNTGKWTIKVKRHQYYFGRWDDPEGALQEYHALMKKLNSTGETEDSRRCSCLTVLEACNAFLNAKDALVQSGDLAKSTLGAYINTCAKVRDCLGRYTIVEDLGPEDFAKFRAKLDGDHQVSTVAQQITHTKILFAWCFESRLISQPVHYGPSFKKPSAMALRRHRRSRGKKLFTPAQLKMICDEAGLHIRAMLLLGINCGFGPTDCATLPLTAFDAERGWVHHHRQKTEVDRSVPLWPATTKALRRVIKRRAPKPDAKQLLFVRYDGSPWTQPYISDGFRAVVRRCGIERGTFYWLRHTFETVAGNTKDQVAVNAIMGHVDGSMAGVYREGIDEKRLRAVVDHVRSWLAA